MDKHLTIGNDGLLRGQLLALDWAHRVKLWLLGLGSLNRLLAVHTLKRLLCRFSAAGFDVIEGDRRVEAVDAASLVDFLKVLGERGILRRGHIEVAAAAKLAETAPAAEAAGTASHAGHRARHGNGRELPGWCVHFRSGKRFNEGKRVFEKAVSVRNRHNAPINRI